jgi:hypothetical protein
VDHTQKPFLFELNFSGDSSFVLIIKFPFHTVTLLGKPSLAIDANVARLILSSLNFGRSVYRRHARHMSAMMLTGPHLVHAFLGDSLGLGVIGVGDVVGKRVDIPSDCFASTLYYFCSVWYSSRIVLFVTWSVAYVKFVPNPLDCIARWFSRIGCGLGGVIGGRHFDVLSGFILYVVLIFLGSGDGQVAGSSQKFLLKVLQRRDKGHSLPVT